MLNPLPKLTLYQGAVHPMTADEYHRALGVNTPEPGECSCGNALADGRPCAECKKILERGYIRDSK